MPISKDKNFYMGKAPNVEEMKKNMEVKIEKIPLPKEGEVKISVHPDGDANWENFFWFNYKEHTEYRDLNKLGFHVDKIVRTEDLPEEEKKIKDDIEKMKEAAIKHFSVK